MNKSLTILALECRGAIAQIPQKPVLLKLPKPPRISARLRIHSKDSGMPESRIETREGSSGIACPHCGERKTAVTDSRPSGMHLRRRRVCIACKSRFTTYEMVAAEDVIDYQI